MDTASEHSLSGLTNNPDDFVVEYYFAPDQLVNENPRAVKITHKPTGMMAISESARTSVQNTALAMREIEETLAIEAAYREELDNISNGAHTFKELYAHRSAIFIALMCQRPDLSWWSTLHHDGTMPFADRIIAGMQLPNGQVTYHFRSEPWQRVLTDSPVPFLDRAPVHDGHTPGDTVSRLVHWVSEDLT